MPGAAVARNERRLRPVADEPIARQAPRELRRRGHLDQGRRPPAVARGRSRAARPNTRRPPRKRALNSFLRDKESQPLIRQKRRVKIEFSVERPLDVVRTAEPVLLTVKQQIEKRDPAPAKRIDHLLGLLRRRDPVLGALEEGDRRRKQPRAVDR